MSARDPPKQRRKVAVTTFVTIFGKIYGMDIEHIANLLYRGNGTRLCSVSTPVACYTHKQVRD